MRPNSSVDLFLLHILPISDVRGGPLDTGEGGGAMVVCVFFKFVQQMVQTKFVLTTREQKIKSSTNRWNV